jgi:SAM-dependent methyltransferase
LSFADCPHINYVSPTGDLSIVRDRFDFVVACHCLEHQPDLIRHLTEVERILNEDGVYLIVVPDKRYCFDFFLPESTIADIIDAHVRRLSVHSLRSVLEHRALITHNEVEAHWRGEHGNIRASVDAGASIRAALAEYEAANGAYIDVHAWKFTPQGFRILQRDMFVLGFTRLEAVRVYNTVLNSSEFCAILQKVSTVAEHCAAETRAACPGEMSG